MSNIFNIKGLNNKYNDSVKFPSIQETYDKTYKFCKSCSKSLPLTEFYKGNFYCKKCHKIKMLKSRYKHIITTAKEFWEKQYHDSYYNQFNLFHPDSTHNKWMLPLFFASIPQKQWHLYLYSYYYVLSAKENLTSKLALKALCGEEILSPQLQATLDLPSNNLINNSDINSELSIPYLTHFYYKKYSQLSRLIAAFIYHKVCQTCNSRKITHEDGKNPVSFANCLTGSSKSRRLYPYHFARDYNTRDGWAPSCIACKTEKDAQEQGLHYIPDNLPDSV